MTRAACRLGDVTSGHGPYPSRPSNEASPDTFVNGIRAMRKGDQFVIHCVGASCHRLGMNRGSGTVFINNKDAIRIGDPVDCGEVMVVGSHDTFIGD
jgi:uncharacterized Zn-binding protein involved in type VI secretion